MISSDSEVKAEDLSASSPDTSPEQPSSTCYACDTTGIRLAGVAGWSSCGAALRVPGLRRWGPARGTAGPAYRGERVLLLVAAASLKPEALASRRKPIDMM
eukprot:47544-Eustigmatos_ZCMA.PRE.1